MKIKVRVQRVEEEEIDVDFPIYLRGGDVFDHGGFYDSWLRIDADGRMITVTSRNDGRDQTTCECSIRGVDLSEAGGYLQSINYARSNAAEFDDMLAQFKARLP